MAKPVVETLYWLPYCSTCTKAEAHLKELGIKIKDYVNVKETTVSRKTLEKLAKQLGGVEKLFSKRAMKYRAWGLNEKELSDDDMLDYMHDEYTFIRRPVLVASNGTVLAGYSKKQYEALMD